MWKRYKAYLSESPVHMFTGLAIPVTVFFWLLWLLSNLGLMHAGYVWQYFALPGDWQDYIHQFWSLVTYPWIHLNLIDFLINLLLLHFVGTQLEIYESHRRMFRLAWTGILAGALGFWVVYAGMPSWFADEPNPYLTGISVIFTAWLGYAGVRLAGYKVNMRLFGHWPWKGLAALFVLWDAVQLPLANTGGHAAHLSAMLGGALWALAVRGIKSKPAPKKSRLKVYESQKPGTEKNIDRILDKINRYGMDSLTEEEKEILYRESLRDNKRKN